jgi:hypothetical protein
MSEIAWNTLGLVLNLVGILLLFAFGMPFRVRTNGIRTLIVSGPRNQRAIRLDNLYGVLGYVGVAMIFIGTSCQIYSQFVAPPSRLDGPSAPVLTR